MLNQGQPGVFELRDAVFGGTASLRVIGHSRNYYDGGAFVGLPLGRLGDFGMLVRTESLAFTDDFLDRLYDAADPLAVSARPPYLDPAGATPWSGEYPAEFRSLLPSLAGYTHYMGDAVPGSPGGYYIQGERRRYDFHDPSRTARGLPVVSRDALGAETAIDYDSFDLLPVRVTDAVGLTTEAAYDYRVLQPRDITDANGNTTTFTFSPVALPVAQFARGKNGEGDRANPSVHMEYDLLAFNDRRQPIFVRSIRRAHHDSETDVPPARRDETTSTIEYSDGFGRLLQSRTQAEDTLFGDAVFGGGVISADQSSPVIDAVGRLRQPSEPDNVVVSGWQVYDNKGRVVQKYEPFFARGYEYSQPAEHQLGQKATMFYDARGQPVRTINADSSEQRVVFGIPPDLANPALYAPCAWERFTYDANDNAGRTHADTAANYEAHWNTPVSTVADALGRTVVSIARNGPDAAKDWFVTRTKYDIQSNLVAVIDALGRQAFSYSFDLAKRRWRMDSIDGGRRDTVTDPIGNTVEARDSKGSLRLHGYDDLHRLLRLWARDDHATSVTLRQHLAYGDGSRAGQEIVERNYARGKNLLGHLSSHHDEAGLTIVAEADFKGNVLVRSRRVISDTAILAGFQQAPAENWQVKPFQVDWQPTGQQSFSDRESTLLELTPYHTTASYDARNRVKALRLPQDVEGKRRELRPEYNLSGGLDRLWLDDALFVEQIAYDARGRRVLTSYGNGVMARCAYDPRSFRLNRIRSERYEKADGVTYRPSGLPLQDYAYEYDLVGNILRLLDRTPGSGILNNPEAITAHDPALAQSWASGNAFNRRFDYDPVYRLLSATGRECDLPSEEPPWDDQPRCTDLARTRSYTERYSYDAVGSMLSLNHHTGSGGFTREFSVDAGNNRLRRLKIDGNIYDYDFDRNGNMRSETTSRHFDWNDNDQIKAFRAQIDGAEPSVYAHYLYDASGQRVKKLVRKQGGYVETTTYIAGVFEHSRWGSGAHADENNVVHVLADQRRVALVFFGPMRPNSAGPAVQFQLGDHLGSSNVVVDSTGAFVNREEFTPYGQTSFGSFANKRYRFNGKERDEESGLSYHRARCYSPWLARWISADPLGAEAGVNAYGFVSCAPLNRIDPNGTDDHEAIAAAGQLQEVATQMDVRKLPNESAAAYGTRMHKMLQEITHSLEPFGPNGRVVTEIVVDGSGKIYTFGGGPADATNLSKALNSETYTADLVLLRAGIHPDDIIGRKLQDVALLGIDYKTGDARLSARQTGLFERLGVGLKKLSRTSDLVDAVAERIVERAGPVCMAKPAPSKVSSSQKGFVDADLMFGVAGVGAIALDVGLRYQAISKQKTFEGRVKETAAWGGSLSGGALGARWCAKWGPEAAAGCGFMGGIAGETAVRTVTENVDDDEISFLSIMIFVAVVF